MFRTVFCALFLSASVLSQGLVRAQDLGPLLLSDKEDYAPFEIALLYGSGFEPGEPIDLSIAISDPETGFHVGDYDWTLEAADDTGAFLTFYEIPLEAAGMQLVATAIGLDSGLTASVRFTDSHYQVVPDTASLTQESETKKIVVSVVISHTHGSLPEPQSVVAQVSNSAFSGFNGSLTKIAQSSTSTTWEGTFESECGRSHTFTGVKINGATSTTTIPGQNPSVTVTCDDQPVILPEPTELVLGSLPEIYITGNCPREVCAVLTSNDDPVGGRRINFEYSTDGGETFISFAAAAVTDNAGVACAELTAPLAAGASVTFRVSFDGDADYESSSVESAAIPVRYAFEGFYAPLGKSQVLVVKKGSTVPVKFNALDCHGEAVTTGTFRIRILDANAEVPTSEPLDLDSGTSNNETDLFRWADTQWIYNLSTKDPLFETKKSYLIQADLGDGGWYVGTISIK